MYSTAYKTWKYIRYYLGAANGKGHGIHSPFVFELVEQVLNDERSFYAFEPIEKIRATLLESKSPIQLIDTLANPQKSIEKKIGEVAAASVPPQKYLHLLFRLIDHYGVKQVLQIGTGFGISTAYIAAANPAGRVTAIESIPVIADIAKSHFQQLGFTNIQLLLGNTEALIPGLLHEQEKLDLIFMDGQQEHSAILHSYELVQPLLHDYSILVFDGIHDSYEMELAWIKIQQAPAVTLSIDLFKLGLIFFRKEFKVKQHLTIRY